MADDSQTEQLEQNEATPVVDTTGEPEPTAETETGNEFYTPVPEELGADPGLGLNSPGHAGDDLPPLEPLQPVDGEPQTLAAETEEAPAGLNILGQKVADTGLEPPRATGLFYNGDQPLPIETINSGAVAGSVGDDDSGDAGDQQAQGRSAEGGELYELKQRVQKIEDRLAALENREANRSVGTTEGGETHPLDKPEHHWLRDLLHSYGIRPGQQQ